MSEQTTQISNNGLQADLAEFIGWVRDFLDYNTLRAALRHSGRYGEELAMARWKQFESNPLGFLVVYGEPLAAYYLDNVWPGRADG